MTVVVTWVLGVLAVVLWVPCATFAVQCLLACLWRSRATAPREPRPRLAVLMPAHDEAAVIGETLSDLLPQLGPTDRLLVVADNCTDSTPEISRDAGAEVIERTDADRRGKGYALVFGLDHLAKDPPEVVVVVDADCTVRPGALDLLAAEAVRTNCPVQADYVFSLPERPSAVAAISALAIIVKNRVRPLGMAMLGLPVPLGGTGMAFPWKVLRMAPPTEGNLVEDLVMGIDLTLLGHPPRFCPEARVVSSLPSAGSAARSQRRRWEHGHLATIAEQGPRLLAAFVRTRRPMLLGMALDLAVPPLALLVTLLLAHVAVSGALMLHQGVATPLLISAAALGAVGLAVLASWARFARSVLPLRSLLAVPFYVLWKIPMYLTYAVRGRHRVWERTDRG